MIDLHSHAPLPYPQGIVAYEPADLPAPNAFPHQCYSVGFHPWSFPENGFPTDEDYDRLKEAASRADVLAIGECGIDLPKGGMLAMQKIAFHRQAELAEELGKPMVIHCVKAHDHVIAIHKELKPKVNWAIHGFRGKPQIAEMLLKEGLWLSFGPQFNEETLRTVPLDRILAETDASGLPIEEVISKMESILGQPLQDLLTTNLTHFLTPSTS